ncbi:sugar phosphate isomerase/epimerase family protein [Halovivax limisalsi]|uniref:sugar phosphate isomerase/epimerase family protein n=1 Tax=Halovivax limisalsi TaxID=1453760 RepID=UPI001FFC2EE8|nr:sugar phosphate isomerase/epimerase [Halovivax limisalsi]
MTGSLGLTVGDSLDRLAATTAAVDFAELSIGDDTAVGPGDVDRIESAFEATSLDPFVHLPFEQVVATGVPELDEAIVTYQSRLLEFAGTVGAEKAVLHGTVRLTQDTDLRPIFVDQLAAIDAAADAEGVELVVENVGHQARGLPLSVLGDLADEAGTAVCFDVGHAYVEDGADGIDRFLSAYADSISHLHVHDVRGRGDTHLPVGAGEIAFDPVAEPLTDFDGSIAIEVFTDDSKLLEDTVSRVRALFQTAEA